MTKSCNTTTGLLRVTLRRWFEMISLSYIDVDMNAINDVFCCDLIILEPQMMQFYRSDLVYQRRKNIFSEIVDDYFRETQESVNTIEHIANVL